MPAFCADVAGVVLLAAKLPNSIRALSVVSLAAGRGVTDLPVCGTHARWFRRYGTVRPIDGSGGVA